jgi:hypothetical protein
MLSSITRGDSDRSISVGHFVPAGHFMTHPDCFSGNDGDQAASILVRVCHTLALDQWYKDARPTRVTGGPRSSLHSAPQAKANAVKLDAALRDMGRPKLKDKST